MAGKTPEQSITDAAYQMALTGAKIDDMMLALSAGYDTGRRKYLDLHPEVRAKIMATPEPKLCGECGRELSPDGIPIQP